MISKKRIWASRVIKTLTILFLLFDAGTHILNPDFVEQGFRQQGFAPGFGPVIGWLTLVFIILYLIPRTTLWGALFLTAYLGGAVAINVRMGAPLSIALSPVYVAVFTWGALWLRSDRLQTLFSAGVSD